MSDLTRYRKVFEVITEASNSISKIALDGVPGGGIIKAICDFGPELRMKRSLEFLDSFQKLLEEKLGRNFYAHEIQNEDFHDLFYIVISKVQTTKSLKKKERFRNILFKQVIKPIDGELAIKYTQIMDDLDDAQFCILSDFKEWEGEAKITSIIRAYLGDEGLKYDGNYIIEGLSNRIGKEVTIAETEYYMNRLVNLGLVNNAAKVITAMGMSSPQNNYRITPIGKAFLNHVEIH